MAETAFIGLGSNLGDKAAYLNSALEKLRQVPGISVIQVSSFYETPPWGYQEQDWFLNAVVEIQTELKPEELLIKLQEIETSMGRMRSIRWGPRTIDLDILLYDQLVIERQDLKIPHPGLAEREFALVPLAEIAPAFRLPDGRTVAELVEQSGICMKKIIVPKMMT
ncbi:MAG: 2-amino-4-hydroxy-6-hydroxymethyldihydropteridine diphosphokinase [Firmicutes bacterium]|nr:2-amino-4-hydroxy-6-hydroxymethyldihydropteridine diphosphokinase [Bacillota bacterium]